MPNLTTTPAAATAPPNLQQKSHDDAIRNAVNQLEASFLTEMLKSAGLGKSREGFGSGGEGEDQFSSFLIRAQAEQITEAGGIGLAESLYHSLKESSHD